ncbi:hypothetical protein B0H21DRAFT_712519 [Amylocystis lapponica]|nr:hypothetical protein B0H21DRAFT_712519 [Amylocystis lapponica]
MLHIQFDRHSHTSISPFSASLAFHLGHSLWAPVVGRRGRLASKPIGSVSSSLTWVAAQPQDRGRFDRPCPSVQGALKTDLSVEIRPLLISEGYARRLCGAGRLLTSMEAVDAICCARLEIRGHQTGAGVVVCGLGASTQIESRCVACTAGAPERVRNLELDQGSVSTATLQQCSFTIHLQGLSCMHMVSRGSAISKTFGVIDSVRQPGWGAPCSRPHLKNNAAFQVAL